MLLPQNLLKNLKKKETVLHQTWPKHVIYGKTWLIQLRKKVLTKFVGNKKQVISTKRFS